MILYELFYFLFGQTKDFQAQFKASVEEVTPIIKQLDKSVRVSIFLPSIQ